MPLPLAPSTSSVIACIAAYIRDANATYAKKWSSFIALARLLGEGGHI